MLKIELVNMVYKVVGLAASKRRTAHNTCYQIIKQGVGNSTLLLVKLLQGG